MGKRSVSTAKAATKAPLPTLPLTWEERAFKRNASMPSLLAVGVDEAGRGPLAGPVVAAAVGILAKDVLKVPVEGVNDSKKVDEENRERLFEELIASDSIVYGVAIVDHEEIDRINILEAAMKAMEDAVVDMQTKLTSGKRSALPPMHVFVDGPRIPKRLAGLPEPLSSKAKAGAAAAVADIVPIPSVHTAEPVVGGDAKVYSIAAASLIAKVTRDRIMRQMDAKYPAYGFAGHKGYGTAAHTAAIYKHGPCAIHRRTFAPVKNWFPVPSEEAEDKAPAEPKKAGKPAAKSKAKGTKTAAKKKTASAVPVGTTNSFDEGSSKKKTTSGVAVSKIANVEVPTVSGVKRRRSSRL